MNNKFENAEMMLNLIQSGVDLYNKDTGDFVFLYSSNGAIAVYKFDLDKAHELTVKYSHQLVNPTLNCGYACILAHS